MCGYYYRQHSTSITHTFDPKVAEQELSLLEFLKNNTKDYKTYNMEEQISVYTVNIVQFTIVCLLLSNYDLRNGLMVIRPLLKNRNFKQGIKKVPFRVRIFIALAKFNQVWMLKIIKNRWDKVRRRKKIV